VETVINMAVQAANNFNAQQAQTFLHVAVVLMLLKMQWTAWNWQFNGPAGAPPSRRRRIKRH